MEPLLWELLNCIFVNFAAVETKRVNHEKPIHKLQELATYFDKYHQTQAMLEDVQGELGIWQKGNSMKDLVKKFQTIRLAFDKSAGFVRDTCFRLWKRYAYEWRKRRVKVRYMALRYRWRTWKIFLEEKHLDSLNDYSRNIENKLARCLKFYEDALAKKKKGYSSGQPADSSLKMLLPTDEKAYSIKKYLERLSRAVSEKLDPVQYDVEEPPVPLPLKSPISAPVAFFNNQHLLTRGPSAAKLDIRGPSNPRSGLGKLDEDEGQAEDLVRQQDGDDSLPQLLARQSSKVMARPAVRCCAA
ncbi:hypothetical protein EON65_13555 [archaeon]|nr:MAG: hypothetical protein EON65_13555 [archaeon]